MANVTRIIRMWHIVGLLLIAMVMSACAPRQWLFPRVGLDIPRIDGFPADFQAPISHTTELPMDGFGGGGGGLNRVPVIFVHGTLSSASTWSAARKQFKQAGYSDDELWAFTYGWNNVRYFDSNDLSTPSLERIVASVTDYLSEKYDRPIHQVDIVAHSLGVTVVRQWLKQTNSYHRVRNFVGIAGVNHGVWTAYSDTRGQNRPLAYEFYPGSPWLAQLNEGGETPGGTRYLMLYDGTGWGDLLYPPGFENSSALAGADNMPYNVENGTNLGHLELPHDEGPLAEVIDWIAKAPQPPRDAERPKLTVYDRTVTANQSGAMVHCAEGKNYPSQRTAAADVHSLSQYTTGDQQASKDDQATAISVDDIGLRTCFSHNANTGLSSSIERFFQLADNDAEAPSKPEELSLSVSPEGGAFQHPVAVDFTSNDPNAVVVYSLVGAEPNSGMALATGPVYVASPLTMTAMAIAADGRRSKPVRLEFDISLERVEAENTWLRQLDEAAPLEYSGDRKKGR